jgi:KDO2-lipid IV(A) lauroyltransferase
MAKKRPQTHLAHPRHWPAWLLVGLLRSVALLPMGALSALGSGIGRLAYRLLPNRRRITRINLRLCFPEKSEDAIEALVHAHFISLGRGVLETLAAWWKPSRALASRLRVEGLEHLHRAQARGGVILLTGHFTTLELAARALCESDVVFHAMYRAHGNPVVDHVMCRLRRRRSRAEPLPREQLRPLLRALRGGGAIWYGPDQTLPRDSVFVDFFGVPTPTLTATAKLARFGRARVVPFFPRRENGRLVVRIHPAWEDFPSGDDEADARRVNAAIEAAVREAVPDYFWIHRRFKIRPVNLPPVYPGKR